MVRDKKQTGAIYVGDATGGVFVLRSVRPNRQGFCNSRYTVPSQDIIESPVALTAAHDHLLVLSASSVAAYDVRFLTSRSPMLQAKMDLVATAGPAVLATTNNFDNIETVVLVHGGMMEAFVVTLPTPPPEPWMTAGNLRWPILFCGALVALGLYYYRSKVAERKDMQGKWKSFEKNWEKGANGRSRATGVEGAPSSYGAADMLSPSAAHEMFEDPTHVPDAQSEPSRRTIDDKMADSDSEGREMMAEEVASTASMGLGGEGEERDRRSKGQSYFPSSSEEEEAEQPPAAIHQHAGLYAAEFGVEGRDAAEYGSEYEVEVEDRDAAEYGSDRDYAGDYAEEELSGTYEEVGEGRGVYEEALDDRSAQQD
jgi:hypothetical protein